MSSKNEKRGTTKRTGTIRATRELTADWDLSWSRVRSTSGMTEAFEERDFFESRKTLIAACDKSLSGKCADASHLPSHPVPSKLAAEEQGLLWISL